MNKALLKDHGGESSLNKAIFPEGIGMRVVPFPMKSVLEMILVK